MPSVVAGIVVVLVGLGLVSGLVVLLPLLLISRPQPLSFGLSPGCDPGVSVPASGDWPTDRVVGRPNAEQIRNATTIITVGKQMRVPAQAIIIALAVAAQESSWVNIGYGDAAGPDSRGLFQQRDPEAPLAVRMDPAGTTRLFYGWLLKVPRWQQMSLGRAGQQVQRSADSSGHWYDVHEPIARYAYAKLGGGADTSQSMCGSTGLTGNCPTSRWPGVERGLTPDALRVLRCAAARWPQIRSVGGIGDRPRQVDDDHQMGRAIDLMIPDWNSPAGRSLGDQIAAWAWANQTSLGVKYVIWHDRLISNSSPEHIRQGWRPYRSPVDPGTTDPTLRHLDHVHISVYGNRAQLSPLPATPGGGGRWVKPLTSVLITGQFGSRGGPWSRPHGGTDMAAPSGTPIMAVAAGTVTWSGWLGTYGNLICIDHGNQISSCYAHQSRRLAQVGQRVNPGQVIGLVGSTGNSTGPHLHFEIRRHGIRVDSVPVLRAHGVNI